MIETLPKRLSITPTHHSGYVYHVTRGVHLSRIKKLGLIAQDKSETNYSSKRNWFSPKLSQAFKLYGIDVVYARYIFSGLPGSRKFASWYFQGIAVLRCRPAHLFSIGYAVDLDLSIAGERKVEPRFLELFIDGKWIRLDRVRFKSSIAPIVFKLTKFLRHRP